MSAEWLRLPPPLARPASTSGPSGDRRHPSGATSKLYQDTQNQGVSRHAGSPDARKEQSKTRSFPTFVPTICRRVPGTTKRKRPERPRQKKHRMDRLIVAWKRNLSVHSTASGAAVLISMASR